MKIISSFSLAGWIQFSEHLQISYSQPIRFVRFDEKVMILGADQKEYGLWG